MSGERGDIQTRLVTALRDAARLLGDTDLPNELGMQMDRLAEQVRQPCTVAVVGRVKAGKSSFINALLGEDLARVGATETTATINYFRYGEPILDRPVTCYWRNGQMTRETREFLDGLQGNDVETLRLADGIDHLEYHLLTPFLEHITLIDTPGTSAAVEEHGRRTAEFMRFDGEPPRYDQETRRLEGAADAVIYLVGAVARSTDRDFLEEFHETTGGRSRALNAIGVLAKIDMHPELVARSEKLGELTTKIAGQLRHNLNTVVPVSAGIRRALDRLLAHDGAGLTGLTAMLRAMAPAVVEEALDDYDAYLDPDLDCPASVEERKELLAMAGHWMVFVTVARALADSSADRDTVLTRLTALAGFDQLNDVLDRHFVRRAHYLRGYRVLTDARKIVDAVKFQYAPRFEQLDRQQAARNERLLSFIRQAPGDPVVAQELESMVLASASRHVDLRPVVDELERSLGLLLAELEEYNADMDALLQLEDHPDLFAEAELDELRPLLGLYGMETDKRLPPGHHSAEYVIQRQQHWYDRQYDTRSVRRAVAERAVARYGFILNEMDRAGAISWR